MQAALGRTGCFRRTVLCVTPGLYEHRINKMKKPLKLFFLIVPLLALCSAATAAQASLEDQLTAAEAKWKMKKPKTYEFSVKFCASCPQSGWGFRLDPIRFRVEDGQASRLTPFYPSVWEALGAFPSWNYSQIEYIFAAIREELKQSPQKVQIEYDPDFGYPRRVFINLRRRPDRQEFDFAVEDFTPVASR